MFFQIFFAYVSVMRDSKVKAIRLTAEECARLEKVVERAKERTMGYATEADVLRELLGIKPMRAVSEDDRYYMTHGKERPRTRSSPA